MPAANKPKAQRGMITAVGQSDGRRLTPPTVITKVVEPERVALGNYRYVNNRSRFLVIKITTLDGRDAEDLRKNPPGPTEDEALVRAVLIHVPEGFIQFHDYAYLTGFATVAKWLDDRIRRGRVRGVGRDTETLRLRCAWCEHTEPNTSAGRDALSRHTIEEHENYDPGVRVLPPGAAPDDEPEFERPAPPAEGDEPS